MSQVINLNDATPAAPAGGRNVKWQGDAPNPDPSVARNISAYTTISNLLNGAGPPGGGLGVDNDYYLDTTAKVLYQRTTGVWNPVASLGGGGVIFTGAYNSGTTYDINQAVSFGRSSYISKVASNLNHQPDISPTQWAILAQGGTDGTALPRDTVVLTTASLAINAEEVGTVALGKSFAIIKLVANDDCRIRLYSTAAQRTADAARPIGIAPAPSTPHGLICEFVLVASGIGLSFICSPEVYGANVDGPAVSNVYYAVQNRSASTQPISVTFTRKVEEP